MLAGAFCRQHGMIGGEEQSLAGGGVIRIGGGADADSASP